MNTEHEDGEEKAQGFTARILDLADQAHGDDEGEFQGYHHAAGVSFIVIDGQMFNEELVEQGYAQAYSYEPNTNYADRFEEAQQEARASGLGIWGLSLQQQCRLANHGNGIGEGSAGCEDAADGSASATSSATASATARPRLALNHQEEWLRSQNRTARLAPR